MKTLLRNDYAEVQGMKGYEIPPKIQTTGPKRLKYGLKSSQDNTLENQKCPQTIFPIMWVGGVSKFWLPGKNDAPDQ